MFFHGTFLILILIHWNSSIVVIWPLFNNTYVRMSPHKTWPHSPHCASLRAQAFSAPAHLGEEPEHRSAGVFGELGNALDQEQTAGVRVAERHGKTEGREEAVSSSAGLFIFSCVHGICILYILVFLFFTYRMCTEIVVGHALYFCA